MKNLLCVFLFVCFTTFANDLKNDYLLNLINNPSNSTHDNFNNQVCFPDSSESNSCIEKICGYLGSFACDDLSEIQNVSKLCRNNFSGACIDFSCSKIGSFGCNELNEISVIAKSCQFVYGSFCHNAVISKITNSFELNEQSEIVKLNNACSLATPDVVNCFNFTCNKIGSYACNELSEVVTVLNSCK